MYNVNCNRYKITFVTNSTKGSEQMQTKEITELFKQKGIKATAQRIAVYKYLYENRIHPDVDTVYKNMVKDNPSFSKTTVYNCLQAAIEAERYLSAKGVI